MLLHPTVALLLSLSPLANAATAEPDAQAVKTSELGQLIAALAQPLPARTAYYEQRLSPLLAQPLRFSGELQRPEDGVLIKTVAQPYVEHTRIAEGRVSLTRDGQPKRQFSLKRAPELVALTAGFEAILSGDAAMLGKHFEIELEATADAWSLMLTPRDSRLARRVVSMHMHGSEQTLRCIDLNLAGDENSRMWIGASAAAASEASDDMGRDALCAGATVAESR